MNRELRLTKNHLGMYMVHLRIEAFEYHGTFDPTHQRLTSLETSRGGPVSSDEFRDNVEDQVKAFYRF